MGMLPFFRDCEKRGKLRFYLLEENDLHWVLRELLVLPFKPQASQFLGMGAAHARDDAGTSFCSPRIFRLGE